MNAVLQQISREQVASAYGQNFAENDLKQIPKRPGRILCFLDPRMEPKSKGNKCGTCDEWCSRAETPTAILLFNCGPSFPARSELLPMDSIPLLALWKPHSCGTSSSKVVYSNHRLIFFRLMPSCVASYCFFCGIESKPWSCNHQGVAPVPVQLPVHHFHPIV